MRFPNVAVILIVSVHFAGSLFAQSLTGREIMVKYKAQDRTNDSSAEETMTLVNASGGQRERRLVFTTKTDADDSRKLLIRFLAPADIAGTGFLSIEHHNRDDDRWLYLPGLRKVRRIAGSDKTDRFVGSDFTYEDLDSEDLDGHDYRLVGSDTVDEVGVWVVEAVAADPTIIGQTGYSKRELWISKEHHLIVRAKYYNKEGAYVKVFEAGDVRHVPGSEKWRAHHMEMADVRRGSRTVLELSRYKIDQGVPDKYFSERYLKREQ